MKKFFIHSFIGLVILGTFGIARAEEYFVSRPVPYDHYLTAEVLNWYLARGCEYQGSNFMNDSRVGWPVSNPYLLKQDVYLCTDHKAVEDVSHDVGQPKQNGQE